MKKISVSCFPVSASLHYLRKDLHNHTDFIVLPSSFLLHAPSLLNYGLRFLCVFLRECAWTSSSFFGSGTKFWNQKFNCVQGVHVQEHCSIKGFFVCFTEHWNLFASHFHVFTQIPDFQHLFPLCCINNLFFVDIFLIAVVCVLLYKSIMNAQK